MPRIAPGKLDPHKFENVQQIGGIQTALIDHPSPGGRPGGGGRIALVNTGSPLRFTVALDRGGDIVEAFFGPYSLCYLSPNGYNPGGEGYHRADRWLRSWPTGLLTSCGPQFIGHPRTEDGCETSLHGHHSNTPAAVETLRNPDPRAGRNDMLLVLTVTDSRFYGPVLEVRREIRCTLGQPEIQITDLITNRGDQTVAHNWLYHVNLGYPLLDAGARLIYRGRYHDQWDLPAQTVARLDARVLDRLKNVPAPLAEHDGENSWGVILDAQPAGDRRCHVGIVNAKLGLGFEMIYDPKQLPRLSNWQHYGPRGCYVTGLEPFSGSLLGKAKDHHPTAGQTLPPGQTRRYDLILRVTDEPGALRRLRQHDGPITIR